MSSRADRARPERPQLKAAVVLAPSRGGDIAFLFGGKRTEISIDAGDLDGFTKLLEHLSGIWTIDEIARLTGLDAIDVESAVAQLHQAGLVCDVPKSEPSVIAGRAIDITNRFFRSIRLDYRRHPLFASLAGNERLFLGCCYEYWFLIRDAEAHISLAIENADSRVRPLLERHLHDERHHAEQIAPVLAEALVVGTSELAVSQPCAACDAAMLKTRDLAKTFLLGYLTATSFCEAPMSLGTSPIGGGESWSASARRLLEAMASHFEEDRQASHARLFHNAFDVLAGGLTRNEIARALSAAHVYKHYLDNLNHEILRMYSLRGTSLPRLATTYEGFDLAS